MKRLSVKAFLLVAMIVPMAIACSSPSSGGKDVISPDQVKQHIADKAKKEGD